MTVLCVVQARTGSTRLPGKVLREVAGRPMLQFMLDRLGDLAVDELVVATSDLARDDAVAHLAIEAGRPVVHASESDVLARFVAALDAYPADHVVRLTGDCPLADPALVEAVIAHHRDRGADYTSNVIPRTFPKGLDVEVVRASVLRVAHAEASDVAEREHVTPFVYRRPERFRLANLRHDVPLGDERWTVDTAEDLDLVREVVALMGGDGRFSWEDALAVAGTRHVPERGTTLRPAYPRDASFVLECRNDVHAVRFSTTGRAVTREEHERWFARRLDDPGTRLWTGCVDGEQVGTVRIDVRCGVAEVGVAVLAAHRGKGHGTALLRALLAEIDGDQQVSALTATVHPDNTASVRAFDGLGFLPEGSREGFLTLRRGLGRPIERV